MFTFFKSGNGFCIVHDSGTRCAAAVDHASAVFMRDALNALEQLIFDEDTMPDDFPEPGGITLARQALRIVPAVSGELCERPDDFPDGSRVPDPDDFHAFDVAGGL